MSNQVKFVVEDRGKGKIALKTADGRYVYIAGAGLSGDVRLTSDCLQGRGVCMAGYAL